MDAFHRPCSEHCALARDPAAHVGSRAGKSDPYSRDSEPEPGAEFKTESGRDSKGWRSQHTGHPPRQALRSADGNERTGLREPHDARLAGREVLSGIQCAPFDFDLVV